MTKSEIINGNLYKHRFVLSGWDKQIADLFAKEVDDEIS